MDVTGIDHLVLYATDVDRTCEFYAETLGVASVEDYGGTHPALSFGSSKLNIHATDDDGRLEAAEPVPGAADFCLVVDEPIATVAERIETAGVEIVDGPRTTSGARGEMQSLYVRDPDGNLVEFAHYAK